MTCDFAVSTGTFQRATQSPQAAQLMKLLVDTATEGLASKFLQGHEEVKKDFKIMQRMACKGGTPMPMSVQAELLKDKGSKPTPAKAGTITQDAVTPGELKKMRQDAKAKRDAKMAPAGGDEEEAERKPAKVEEQKGPQRIRVPTHKLVHSGSIDLTNYMESSNSGPTAPVSTVPRLLKLTVELPTVKRSSDVSLEVTSTNVVVEVPEKYYLDLPLSYDIEEDKGVAKFDKVKQVLTLELPVIPKAPAAGLVASVGEVVGTDEDGALSEGHGSDDELPPLQDPPQALNGVPAQADPAAAEPAGQPPPEEPAAPPAEPLAPANELLEVGHEGGALRISKAAEGPDETSTVRLEEAVQTVGEQLPDFIECSSFEGRRPGFYFSTGDQGLGYYRDSRQPMPGSGGATSSRSLPPQADNTDGERRMPLVTEVDLPFEQEVERAPLPLSLRLHVEATSMLSKRVEAGATGSRDLPLQWRQNRQNLVLLVDVPAETDVADVRVQLLTQRLTLTFCTRPARPEAAWQRYIFRRTLSALADARQWHAELDRGGAGGTCQLIVVLRKVDQAEMWSEAFDTTAACVCTPVSVSEDLEAAEPVISGTPALQDSGGGGGATSSSDSVAARQGNDGSSTPAVASAGGGASAVEDDSAELDAGAGMASPGDSAAPAAQGPAPAALVQSATTMGRGVLLSNRLMYQLL